MALRPAAHCGVGWPPGDGPCGKHRHPCRWRGGGGRVAARWQRRSPGVLALFGGAGCTTLRSCGFGCSGRWRSRLTTARSRSGGRRNACCWPAVGATQPGRVGGGPPPGPVGRAAAPNPRRDPAVTCQAAATGRIDHALSLQAADPAKSAAAWAAVDRANPSSIGGPSVTPVARVHDRSVSATAHLDLTPASLRPRTEPRTQPLPGGGECRRRA